MNITTLSPKSQTTVPTEVREYYHLAPGAKLDWSLDPITKVFTVRPITSDWRRLSGCLHRPGEATLSHEIQKALIEEVVVEDDERTKPSVEAM